MKTVPVWVYYSVIRVLLFVVPLAVLLALRVEPALSAVFAAIIGLCVSYLLLRRPREGLAHNLYAARHRDTTRVGVDAESEDAAIARVESAERAEAAVRETTAPAGLGEHSEPTGSTAPSTGPTTRPAR